MPAKTRAFIDMPQAALSGTLENPAENPR